MSKGGITKGSVGSALVFGEAVTANVTSASQLSRFLAEQGAPTLLQIESACLKELWNDLLDQLIESESPFWQSHCNLEAVADEFGLHPRSLTVALRASIPGLRMTDASLSAVSTDKHLAAPKTQAVLAVLAGNVPVLLLQVLLPALLARQPIAFKLPSAPSGATADSFHLRLLHWLAERDARLAYGIAALSWRGGEAHTHDTPFERALMAATPSWKRVLVYGGANAVRTYRRLAQPNQLIAFGPKTSVALVVDDTAEASSWAAPVARDVALFEQQGCLSVSSVLLVASEVPAHGVDRGAQLAAELRTLTDELPLPLSGAFAAASARHWIDTTVLSGSQVWGDLAGGGTVIDSKDIEATPQGRTVRLIRVPDLASALMLIEQRQRAQGDLQGVALAGIAERDQDAVETRLRELGVSRTAPAGRLQETDLGWCNGGVDLLAEFLS